MAAVRLKPLLRSLVRAALAEDLGARGDVTTRFFVPKSARLRARIIARKPGVLAGMAAAAETFRQAAPGARFRALAKDGARLRAGQAIAEIVGGREILTAERTALNFLQRLSGVATLTARFVRETKGTRAEIFDTRKTLPGWRALDKHAVACGGGRNHRMGLYDAVLVKDNHWSYGRGGVLRAVRAVRRRHPGLPVEIEADDLSQVARALEAGADIILLDNMGLARLKQAIALIRRRRPKTQIEVSGGLGLEDIRPVAKLNPDRISIGRLTHSAPALDLSLET